MQWGRKKSSRPAELHPQAVSQPSLSAHSEQLWELPALFPLKDRLKNASEPSRADFNAVSTASASHSSECL